MNQIQEPVDAEPTTPDPVILNIQLQNILIKLTQINKDIGSMTYQVKQLRKQVKKKETPR